MTTPLTVSPTLTNVFAQLGVFLRSILPTNVDVIQAQINRVPEPKGTTFVVMTAIRQERLRTNVDSYSDSKFTGSIAGDQMTVTAVDPVLFSPLLIGSTVFGVGVADGTRVKAFGTGTGGLGVYTMTNSQTLSSRTLSAGAENIEQGVKHTIQLDFHAPKIADAGDLATVVSTLFRDAYAVQSFKNQTNNYGVVPLLADDPRQMPFLNDQQQYESRWVVEAMLQANAVVIVPQQFADSASVEVIDVDAEYAP